MPSRPVLRVTVLGSGSRGNAILVDGTHGALLIDNGFSPRALAKRLQAIGRRPEQIAGMLVTHEHTDHACGAVDACRKWGWTLHATEGTLAALADAPGGCAVTTATLSNDGPTAMDGWTVDVTRVPHDARECSAFVLTDGPSGARVGIALDLGHVPTELPAAFSRLDLLVVESNHDERLLFNGPYPYMLKQRVGGDLGHLGNGAAAAFVAGCAHRGLRGVLLAHLSETNNTPEHALARTRDALRKAGWRRDALWAAHQVTACGPIGMDGATTFQQPLQLSFGL
jgi:phosphoribosyl 1,2-cyclic phosphodiesterase